MKNYTNYEIEDFAADDAFIAWCLQPDDATEAFWQNWLHQHPHCQAAIAEARQLVLDLYAIEAETNEVNFEQEVWEKIGANTNAGSSKTATRKWLWLGAVAASIFIVIGVFSLWEINNYQDVPTAKVQWINLENDSGIAKTIQLADQSIITLEPFSTLKYPNVFEGTQRIVFLKGEAFFDIERDTLKPFLIYANKTITKVLGTSFRITAYEGQEKVEVDVKTGKVAVYAQVTPEKKTEKKEEKMIIQTDEKIYIPRPDKKLEVTPNQKVVFDAKASDMIKTVTQLPTIITKIEALPQFQFKDESVVKVFEALQEAYGIDFEFDKEKLSTCTITTKLNDEPLFEKLNIICTALNLTFNENDATIFIHGYGCY